MSETLVIALGPDGQPAGDALLLDAATVLARVKPDALGAKAGTDAVIVIPGAQVASHLVQVPDFPDAKLMKILPGLLDNRMALMQEDRHFALLGPGRKETGDRLIGVMAKAEMQAALDVAQGYGLVVRAVVPDYMLLPVPAEGQVAATAGDSMLVRAADSTGFSAEAGLAAQMLGTGTKPEPLDYQSLLATATDAPANLMQGAFSPRKSMAAWLVVARRAGFLAAASLLLWVGATLYSASDNFSRSDALYAQAEARFKAALPDVGRIVNMEAQMRRAVQAARQQDGGEFLILSGMAASALTGDDSTMFEGMRFDGTQNTLVLTVTFASFAKGEAYKARLAEKGLVVTEGSSRTEGARVMSELTIRRRV